MLRSQLFVDIAVLGEQTDDIKPVDKEMSAAAASSNHFGACQVRAGREFSALAFLVAAGQVLNAKHFSLR